MPDDDELVRDILKRKRGGIRQATLEPGSPSWDDILDLNWAEVVSRAEADEPGFRTIKKTAGRQEVRPMSATNATPAPGPKLDPTSLQKLLDFLSKLQAHNHHYRLACWRDAIMVELAVPGERWEVEFFADGSVEVERFRSDGRIADGSALDELFTTFA